MKILKFYCLRQGTPKRDVVGKSQTIGLRSSAHRSGNALKRRFLGPKSTNRRALLVVNAHRGGTPSLDPRPEPLATGSWV